MNVVKRKFREGYYVDLLSKKIKTEDTKNKESHNNLCKKPDDKKQKKTDTLPEILMTEPIYYTNSSEAKKIEKMTLISSANDEKIILFTEDNYTRIINPIDFLNIPNTFEDTVKKQNEAPRKYSELAFLSFFSSIVGLLIATLLFGTLAIVIGGISLGIINKNRDKLKGAGIALIGIVIGFIEIVLILSLL